MRKVFFISLLLYSVSLLNGCKDENNPVTPPSEHFEPFGWLIADDTEQPVLVVWEGTILNEWQNISLNDSLTVGQGLISEHYNIKFISEDSTVVDAPEISDYTFGYSILDSSIVNILADEAGGWGFHLKGINPGVSAVEFRVLHLGHVDIRTPYISVTVTN